MGNRGAGLSLALILLGCGATPVPRPSAPLRKLVYTAPSGLRFVLVEGGEFLMGGEFGEPEKPVKATVSSFWMAETLLTNRQIELVAHKRKRPSTSRTDDQPANGRTYAEILKVVEAFRKKDQLPYELPTDTEWEYTARSGLEQKYFPWGNGVPHGRSQVESLVTAPVWKFLPNAFGVYDAWGNLDQLVREAYFTPDASYFAKPDPLGPLQGSMRLTRGGSHSIIFMPIAIRMPMPPDDAEIWTLVGFRFVLADGPKMRDQAEWEEFTTYRD